MGRPTGPFRIVDSKGWTKWLVQQVKLRLSLAVRLESALRHARCWRGKVQRWPLLTCSKKKVRSSPNAFARMAERRSFGLSTLPMKRQSNACSARLQIRSVRSEERRGGSEGGCRGEGA